MEHGTTEVAPDPTGSAASTDGAVHQVMLSPAVLLLAHTGESHDQSLVVESAFAVAVLGLAGTFILAGYSKVSAPRHLVDALRPALRDARWAIAASRGFGLLEVILGLGLLLESVFDAFLFASLLLMLALSVGVMAIVLIGLPVGCACFGASRDSTLGWLHVSRNLVLVAMLLALILSGDTSVELEVWLTVLPLGLIVALVMKYWTETIRILS